MSLQGLTEWQLNSYYAAGRVMVPALLDIFTCQGFFKRQALLDLLTELAGVCAAGLLVVSADCAAQPVWAAFAPVLRLASQRVHGQAVPGSGALVGGIWLRMVTMLLSCR